MTDQQAENSAAPEEAARKRGRPVQMDMAAREDRVLDCAIALLSEHGPEAVTMADIARRAGMSKRTLYTLYRSREELLAAGLGRMCGALFRTLTPDEREASLEDRLRLLLSFNPKREPTGVAMEMLRIVIAEARAFPEMAKQLSRRGPVEVAGLLSDELQRAREAGEIALDPADIPAAAALLVDMAVGNAIPMLLDPDRILHKHEDQEARRDMAIAIFLNGVRPR